MRKLLLSLFALLTAGGAAWADGISVYIRNAAAANSYVSSDYKYAASKDAATTFSLTSVVIDSEQYYTIYNETAQQYVNFTATANGTENVLTNAAEVTDNSYWRIMWGSSDATNYGFYITPKGGSNVSWNYFGGNAVGKSIGLWTSTQNGTWVLEAAETGVDTWACTFKSERIVGETVSDRGSWAVSGSDATKFSSIRSLGLAYDGSDVKQQFALMTYKSNYYIYSVAAKKFVLKTADLSNESAEPVTLMPTGNKNYPWKFKFDDSHYINLGGSGQITIDTWSSTDQGNSIAIHPQAPVSLEEAENLLAKFATEALIQEAINTYPESKKGVLGYPTDEAYSQLYAAIAKASGTNPNYDDVYDEVFTAFNNAKSSANYTPRTDVYYTITNPVWGTDGSRGSMIYNPDVTHKDETSGEVGVGADYIWSTAQVGLLTRNVESEDGTQKTEQYWAYGATTLDDQNPNHLWGFIQGEDGSYYMYNVGKMQFASIGQGHPDKSYGDVWIFSDTPSIITMNDGDTHLYIAPNVRFQATIPSTGVTYNMSMSNHYIGPFITYYANDDGGVPMQFAESTYPINDEVTAHIKSLIESVTPYREALQAVIDGVASISFGDGLGEYSTSSDYDSALAAAKVEVANEKATKESLTKAREALEEAIAALPLNMPEEGMFLRLTGTSGYYLSEDIAINDNSTFTMSNTENATTIFYYDGSHLINLSTGKANAMSSSQWEWVYGTETASDVTFSKGSERGMYYVQSADTYFRDNNEGYCVRKGNATNWTLTEITELPITVYSLGFATLWSPVALTIPGGVYAYTGVVNDNGDYLLLTQVEGTIPAETAVLLQAGSGRYYFPVTAEAGTAVGNNALKGGLGQDGVSGSILTLQQSNGVPGFYTYTGTGAAGFKAYLTRDDAAEIKGFIFGDDATGIAGIENGNTAEGTALYNLAGQRVAKTVKGIYVVGGKKVLVK